MMEIMDNVLAFLGAAVAGLSAAISGFGIGSILTPIVAVKMGTKLAIAAVAIPHLTGTFLRFCILRKKVDKRIFLQFGIASIIGGLVGAFLFWQFSSPALTLIFGLILIFASFMDFSGITRKLKFGKVIALFGGILSGFLGGLVGNQGGIRSAALLSYNMDKEVFVATATAIGLVVDVVRIPIYLITQKSALIKITAYIIVAILGVVVGTLVGIKLLRKIPATIFSHVVAGLILILGVYMVYIGIFGNIEIKS